MDDLISNNSDGGAVEEDELAAALDDWGGEEEGNEDEEAHVGASFEPSQSSNQSSSAGIGSDEDLDAHAEALLNDMERMEYETQAGLHQEHQHDIPRHPSQPTPATLVSASPAVVAEADSMGAGDASGEGQPSAPKRRRVTARRAGGSGNMDASEGSAAEQADPVAHGGLPAGPLGAETVQQQQGTVEEPGGCPHPSYWAGMCVACGAQKPADEEGPPGAAGGSSSDGPGTAAGHTRWQGGWGSTKGDTRGATGTASRAGGTSAGTGTTQIRHLHSRGALEIGAAEAARLRKLEADRLRATKRLVLVLDLDHTLLNSVRLSEVTPEHDRMLHGILEAEADKPHKLLHCLRDKWLWTKLRPAVHEFLQELRPLYELHIYTMGDRTYAAEVRRLLDPERKLFTSVISQNDSTSTHAKDLDVALSDDRLVLIMDDTEQVWPRHRQNLIQVERYHFFPASIRQFNSDAKSLLEMGKDESATNGTLATCLAVLKDVHAQFYNTAESESTAHHDHVPLDKRDARYFLSRRREMVLKGCVLLFSHCWPQGAAEAHSHPLWQLAERLGAEVATQYDPSRITHVVAGAPGTAKVHQAQKDGKHVVAPDWLQACLLRWQRVDESTCPVTGARTANGKRPYMTHNPSEELRMVLAAAGGGGGGGGSGAAASNQNQGAQGSAGYAAGSSAGGSQLPPQASELSTAGEAVTGPGAKGVSEAGAGEEGPDASKHLGNGSKPSLEHSGKDSDRREAEVGDGGQPGPGMGSPPAQSAEGEDGAAPKLGNGLSVGTHPSSGAGGPDAGDSAPDPTSAREVAGFAHKAVGQLGSQGVDQGTTAHVDQQVNEAEELFEGMSDD